MTTCNATITFNPTRGATISGCFGEYRFILAAGVLESWLVDRHFASREFPDRAVDLMRIAGSVFAVDRAIKRAGKARSFMLKIPVHDLDFWSRPAVAALTREAVEEVSQDFWELNFSAESGPRAPALRSGFDFRSHPPVVCLQSGGLDSAAGLANQLIRGTDRDFLAIMARHEGNQGSRAEAQLARLKSHFHTSLDWKLVNAEFKPPKERMNHEQKPSRTTRFRDQESSQRCRSFLHLTLGGVVAAQTGGSEVEVYESGVGAINLPLQHSVGWRPTRHAHPRYLELMGRLLSMVADRPITFRLPFLDSTKGEVVRGLAGRGLDDLIRETFSCVHFPRLGEKHRQCGLCTGCLYRRFSLAVADVSHADGPYQYDLFGEVEVVNAIAGDHLRYLKAILHQVFDLARLEADTELPAWLTNHLVGTGIVKEGMELPPYIDLLLRYRRECLAVIERMGNRGYEWTK